MAFWIMLSDIINTLAQLQILETVSVQFSYSVVSDSLRPHESQQARPPCPLPAPGVHPNSCPLSQWCYPAISSSVVPFSSCLQSLPASESFPMSQLFTWGGQSIGVSILASFLPKNTQDWSPLEWTDCISLQSKGLSRVFSNTTVQKHIAIGNFMSYMWKILLISEMNETEQLEVNIKGKRKLYESGELKLFPVFLKKIHSFLMVLFSLLGCCFRGTSGKEPACQCWRHKRCVFDLWVGKIPWRRAWQPTPVFLPRESHGQRSLVGFSP